jgi:hypothetical protein
MLVEKNDFVERLSTSRLIADAEATQKFIGVIGYIDGYRGQIVITKTREEEEESTNCSFSLDQIAAYDYLVRLLDIDTSTTRCAPN